MSIAIALAIWMALAVVAAVAWSRFHASIRSRRAADQQHHEEAA